MRANRLLFILFLLLAAAIYFLPVFDTDFGWHYRCGVDLLAGQPCLTNTYSYYLAGYQWAYPSFLYDAVTAVVFDRAGFLGLSVVGSLLFAGVAAVVWWGSRLPKLVTVVGFLAATALSWSVLGLGLRSQLATLLMTLLTVALLCHSERREKNPSDSNRRGATLNTGLRMTLLLVLFLLWTNAHGGFFMGPVLVGFWAMGEVLQFETRRVASLQTLSFLFVLTFLSFLITFLNPFGPAVWAEVWRHFQMPLNTLIAEWVGPPWWHWFIIGGLDLLYLWLAYAELRRSGVSQKSKWSIFSLLTLGLLTVLALSARRNLPLYYFSYVLLFPFPRIFGRDAACGVSNVRCFLSKFETPNMASLQIILLVLAVVSIAAWRLPLTILADTSWSAYCSSGYQKYPCDAANYLKTQPAGNVYSAFEWGGFLIWQLGSPQPGEGGLPWKVFVDGRTPAWTAPNGESPYTTYLKIIQAREGWSETLAQYHTDYLLIPQGSFLDILLQKEAASYNYKELYRDSLAAVYKRL